MLELEEPVSLELALLELVVLELEEPVSLELALLELEPVKLY